MVQFLSIFADTLLPDSRRNKGKTKQLQIKTDLASIGKREENYGIFRL